MLLELGSTRQTSQAYVYIYPYVTEIELIFFRAQPTSLAEPASVWPCRSLLNVRQLSELWELIATA